jgi:hypothetical protein
MNVGYAVSDKDSSAASICWQLVGKYARLGVPPFIDYHGMAAQ